MFKNDQLKKIGIQAFCKFVSKLNEHEFAQSCLDDYYEQTRNVDFKPIDRDSKYLLQNIYFEVVCFSAFCLAINAANHFKKKVLFHAKFDKKSWYEVYDGIEESLINEFIQTDSEIIPFASDGAKMAFISYMQNLMNYDANANLLDKIEEAKNSDMKIGFSLFSSRLSNSIDPNLCNKWRAFITQWIPTGKQLLDLTNETLVEEIKKFEK